MRFASLERGGRLFVIDWATEHVFEVIPDPSVWEVPMFISTPPAEAAEIMESKRKQ